jgi:hypothetical protein
MKYGQIIGQAWQIFRRTKLLWLFAFMYFLSGFITFDKSSSSILACISLSLILLSLFLFSFSLIGMILCVDEVIRGESPSLREIWLQYKANLGRSFLLFNSVSIPFIIIYFCANISLTGIISDKSIRSYLAGGVITLFASGFLSFCFYGLILHKMGVLKSLKHGIAVFSMNWYKVVILTALVDFPLIIPYLILYGVLLARGSLTSASFFQVLAEFPIRLLSNALGSFIAPLSAAIILLAYNQFIKEFDYPTLQPVPSKT